MDTTKYIKALAIADLIILAIYLSLGSYLESSLHPILQEYLALESEFELSNLQLVGALFAVIGGLSHLIAIIGLVFGKLFAKKLFIYSLPIGYIGAAIMGGSYIEHALTYVVNDISMLVTGIIFALLTFTQSAFNKRKQQD